ncbi:ribonuclease BN [Novosphingobium aromaticivorans DSM 12444]|uniref:Ribonuclease BN n=1 Tax=Novosphingobium aromaticivorans (strain ATCC 700278 / DSM 12444 / CCUG 56034 / CIP 105152 / NBRC 16084 / F199) TaxID=279238 RepID=Q2GCC4_NOVAD|nr:YihY/virulence factor BrkB family protein [Novosphingobium aromaticivorans]ABD24499.1 ribonuclease BN [Novosphingobium aromaticivorans DSM 12444]SCY26437.1 membrane protein [Novosphingobium aromaticivorans]
MEPGHLPPGAHPLVEVPDLSPEARRREALRWRAGLADAREKLGPGSKAWEVVKRVWTGVFNDGSIHAGNLAYMIIIALFPFFITGAALFSFFGEASQRAAAIDTVLIAMPPVVAATIEPAARSVIEARTGWLLWVGGIFGLWTVGSLVETIRDILRRAYGTRWEHALWRYRLMSTGITLASVVLILLAIFAQVLIGAAQEVIEAFLPQFGDLVASLSLSRFVPAFVLYAALWLLFISLTPGAYRGRDYPKWPGALFVTIWWIAVTTVLPGMLRTFFSYDLTYGSLAGIMIALFFFWLVGLGMVVGAELNAALTETPEERDMLGQADDRARAIRNNETRSENENA